MSLKEVGLLTAKELAVKLGISSFGVRARRARGCLKAYRIDDAGQCLYDNPSRTSEMEGIVTPRSKELQYE